MSTCSAESTKAQWIKLYERSDRGQHHRLRQPVGPIDWNATFARECARECTCIVPKLPNLFACWDETRHKMSFTMYIRTDVSGIIDRAWLRGERAVAVERIKPPLHTHLEHRLHAVSSTEMILRTYT